MGDPTLPADNSILGRLRARQAGQAAPEALAVPAGTVAPPSAIGRTAAPSPAAPLAFNTPDAPGGIFLGGQPSAAPQVPIQEPAGPNIPVALSTNGVADPLRALQGIYNAPPGRGGGPLVRDVRTATTHAPVAQETLSALGQDTAEIERALTERSRVTGDVLGQQGSALEGATQQSVDEAGRQQQAAAATRQLMDRRVGEAQDINQRVLDGKINPNAVLGDTMSGGRIAAAIGLWFAGMAQGQQGADAFLSNINRTVDRDIAAQQANMENLRAAGNAQQNLVSMYRETLGDQEAGAKAARATMLQSVAQKLEAMQARMGQQMQPPELALTIAQLHQMADQASAEAQQGAWTNTQTVRSQSGGGGGGPTVQQRIAAASAAGGMANTAVNNDVQNMVRVMAEQRQGAGATDGPQANRQAWATLENTHPGWTARDPLAPAPRGDALTKPLEVVRSANELDAILAEAERQHNILTDRNLNIFAKNSANAELTRLAALAGQTLGNMNQAGAQGDVESARYIAQAGITAGARPFDSLLRGENAGLVDIQRARAGFRAVRDRHMDLLGLQRGQQAATPTPAW